MLLLPWVLVLGFVSPLVTPVAFLCTIVGMGGLGALVLRGIRAPLTGEDRLFLALPTGFMTATSLIALAIRSGVAPQTAFWTVAIAALGALAWSGALRRSLWAARWCEARGLIALSLTVALVYFLPGAVRDAVFLPDGSYRWMYVDTQYHCALAASVKSCVGLPKLPDMGIAELRYHFGPDGVAGAMSAALNLPIGDAVARVVRPAALLSLLLASYSLGRVLVHGSGREHGGGILAATGLFFYGSVFSLFANNVNSSSLVSGALLYQLPYVEVASSGGPFSHLILGGSALPGLSGLLVLVTVLLAKLRGSDHRPLAADLFSLGPAALFPINLLLGIASNVLTALLLLGRGARNWRVWVNVAMVAGAAFLSVQAMGYLDSPMTSRTEFAPVRLMAERLFQFFVWFHVGLGVRLFAFARMKNPLRDAASAVLIILVAGFVSLGLFFQDHYWNNTRYGFFFAQATLSCFSFAWLSEPAYRVFVTRDLSELASAVAAFLRVVILSASAFLACGILCYAFANINPEAHFSAMMTIKAASLLLAVAAAALFTVTRAGHLGTGVAWLTAAFCLLGFAAWITDWVNYGLDRMRTDVIVSKDEASGLAALRRGSQKGDLIATNQHALAGFRRGAERSYAYGALSERTMLLEGWKSGGADNHPLFAATKMANDLLFSTSDEKVARGVVEKLNIRFIVAKPGTDLSLPKPLPHWLSPISETGSLKVYRVQYPARRAWLGR